MVSEALLAAVHARYPGAPGLYREEVARRLEAADLPLPRMRNAAIDDMMASVVRHQLTDYDHLMQQAGLSRDEARQCVAEEVADWLATWR